MFTGIVTDIGEIVSVEEHGSARRIAIACNYPLASIQIGASIANGGICLTVTTLAPGADRDTVFTVDASAETIARTTLGAWAPGGRVNLERALRIGDELGGHIVSGHVDGIAEVLSREDSDGTARFVLRAPTPLARFIAEKGSVALDGTSLTVNKVEGDIFSVMMIPHTLAVTTWGAAKPGHHANIEIDTMARYAARLADTRDAGY
jgi:riboflavin synthase